MWHVESISGSTPEGYTITLCQNDPCEECSSNQMICTAKECSCLCIHMYKCGNRCYNYNNGHICKHIHCVHSIQRKKQQEQTKSTVPEIPEEQYDRIEDEENGSIAYTESVAFAESVADPQRGA